MHKRNWMYITSEPKNDVYRYLVDLAFDLCDELTLDIRKELN